MSRSGSSSTAGGPPAAGSGNGADASGRRRSNDLGLELYRQRTLLQIMAARLRETSGGVERGASIDLARIRRALDVHHRFLIEVHHADAERVARAVAKQEVAAAGGVLAELEKGRTRAAEFENSASTLVAQGVAGHSENAHRLAQLVHSEADRIDQFQGWEAERLHAHLDDWLPKPIQSRLLGQIRKFDAARVDAEIALISWASQLHPSAD